MSETICRYIRSQVIAAVLINGVLNALVAWLSNRSKTPEPVELAVFVRNLVIDILITSLIVGILNAWSANYNLTKKGWKKSLTPSDSTTIFFANMWHWTTLSALLLIILFVGVVGGLTAGYILLVSHQPFSLLGYTLHKTFYTALLGGIATGITLWASCYRPLNRAAPQQEEA